jgi:hypothetical protein
LITVRGDKLELCLKVRRLLAGLAILLFGVVWTGCGDSRKPVVAPIEFTDPQGKPVTDPQGKPVAVTSLAVGQTVNLVATVTNDNSLLGVSWTVTCGSAPPAGTVTISNACGSFTLSQTASGPVPSYPSSGIVTTYNAPSAIPKGETVTITAHATSLPSVTSSVTLTIVPAPQGALAPVALPAHGGAAHSA